MSRHIEVSWHILWMTKFSKEVVFHILFITNLKQKKLLFPIVRALSYVVWEMLEFLQHRYSLELNNFFLAWKMPRFPCQIYISLSKYCFCAWNPKHEVVMDSKQNVHESIMNMIFIFRQWYEMWFPWMSISAIFHHFELKTFPPLQDFNHVQLVDTYTRFRLEALKAGIHNKAFWSEMDSMKSQKLPVT